MERPVRPLLLPGLLAALAVFFQAPITGGQVFSFDSLGTALLSRGAVRDSLTGFSGTAILPPGTTTTFQAEAADVSGLLVVAGSKVGAGTASGATPAAPAPTLDLTVYSEGAAAFRLLPGAYLDSVSR